MSLSMKLPEGAADADRRRRLRRMRAVALGLLVFAAVVYLLTLHGDGLWGYVNAGAEASMVGAIADWFAVTALFRHPLGLPIPHTALIPRRKDDLGRSLEDFVTENFLQEEIIRERLTSTEVARRVGEWLRDPDHATRAAQEIAALLVTALRRFDEEDVRALMSEVLIPRLLEEPVAPIAGNLLAQIVADDAHHGLVDLALEEGHHWLIHHQETFTNIIAERAPKWAPSVLNDIVTERIHLEAVRWIADIRRDPQHRARTALDSLLTQLAADLLGKPSTQERAERLKERLLTHPQLLTSGASVYDALQRALIDGLTAPDSLVRRRIAAELVGLGERLETDETLRTKIDGVVSDAVVFAVNRYGGELTAVITHTIQRWDGKEAAERIELHVGRDLQFIRINGTIVGGLVGVVIHAVTSVVA